MITRYLPVPDTAEALATAEAFADIVMDRKKKKTPDESQPKTWRNVGLMPLSREQMRAFAVTQHVPDPDALLADIKRRDAEEFAERPQDLIELCSDWKEHQHIRRHGDQVAANVANKLKARADRPEKAQLSDERLGWRHKLRALGAVWKRR